MKGGGGLASPEKYFKKYIGTINNYLLLSRVGCAVFLNNWMNVGVSHGIKDFFPINIVVLFVSKPLAPCSFVQGHGCHGCTAAQLQPQWRIAPPI